MIFLILLGVFGVGAVYLKSKTVCKVTKKILHVQIFLTENACLVHICSVFVHFFDL